MTTNVEIQHLSDLMLDRHRLGELAGDELAHVATHLRACEQCGKRLQALIDDDRVFQGRFSLPELSKEALEKAKQRPAQRWGVLRTLSTMTAISPARLSLVAAAAVCVIGLTTLPRILFHSRTVEPTAPTIRYKGGFSVRVYVRRKGVSKPWVLNKDEVLKPHDQLRFVFDTTQSGYIYLLGADSLGSVMVYDPVRGQQPGLVKRGVRQVIKGAIELDDKAAREAFYVALCNKADLAEDLLKKLRSSEAKVQPEEALTHVGCEVTYIALRKDL